ncbi:MAG: type I-C CRISPR-associated protein Cas7/Csd2 [Chlorobiaceae bacterium]|nr:type I-C CRISPR-associated protein Cas7/Csd2 [Chlorobiaceae bacterium]
MSTLSQKIDFAIIMRVKNANPNGDPLNGNRPRIDLYGHGEMTDVCLKRKIRDRIMELKDNNGDYKYDIFVQSDDRKRDAYTSLKARFEGVIGKNVKEAEAIEKARKTWFDVRAFGQLFAFDGDEGSGLSIPIRGPVSIQSAFTLTPVNVSSVQITKSVSGNEGKNGKRSSDTMGMKHRVDRGIYITFGSMNPQLAERTEFSDTDAEAIKSILPKLFENDASSARPEGSMEVVSVIWWAHGSKPGKYSSAKVHRSLHVNDDGSYRLDKLDGLEPDPIPGF